jgi:hypothetical protein
MIPRIRLGMFVYIVGVAIALLLTNAVPCRAQVAGATLTGTITDSSGGQVPNAQVVIKDVSTGVERTVTTNKDGFYIAANLLPAEYQVTVTATGFNTEIKNGIKLNVGMEQEFNLVLQVGTVTHRVEVTAEAPAVQLSTSDISATVQATTVRELPLNGRSWTDLAALQPGVDTIQTQPSFSSGADRGNRGFGQQLTISGARPQQNNYRLDGVSLNDYANGAPGSVLGGSLGVDAIQEFSVLTSNYSAEYGKTSGGVVNAITRSGTGSFHGSAYEFLRNSALDARNFFDGPQIPSFKRNQFGGSIGGPIIKERTFFFFDYEGIRQSKGLTQVTTVPSLPARSGFLQGSATPVTIDPAAQAALAFYHLPNGPVSPDNPDIAEYRFSGQQVVSENFYTTRLDHKISEKDSMSGTYLFDKTPYTSPDGVNDVLLTTKSSRQIAVLEETHIFKPTFANSVRFGYNYENVDNNVGAKALVPAAADTSLGTFPGRTAPQIFINGLTTFLGGVGGEAAYFYHWNTFQLYDDAFVNKGTHTIKFGFAAERMELEIKALSDPNGIFHFADLASFYANSPNRFQGGIASTLTPRNLRQTLLGGYVQDDWRFKPNLTLNLGLRYEMVTVPTETDGKLSVLRNLSDATPHLGDPFFNNPTTKNFEPRIGFAWDPFRNGKMAVRGGFGMFDVLPLPYQFTLLTTLAAPFFAYTSVNNPGVGSFPNNLPPLPSNTLRATYIDPNPKRNYVMQYNLNIQYQLTPSLTSLVAYVGSRGIHQPYRPDDADIVIPTRTSAGYLFPKVDVVGNAFSPTCNQVDPKATPGDDPNLCAPPARINENYGSVRGMFYEGQSYYNALETQLAKRMSHGFQVQGTFTWGRSIDTSSATVAGDAFGNSIASPSYFFNPRVSRALSDFNVSRTLVINGLWELPSPKSITGPARFLTEGWQLGVIFTASTGIPFTPTFATGSDPNGTLSSDDWAYPNRLGGAGCQSLTNPGNPDNYIKTGCFAVPVAPSQAFFDANCDPAPPSVGAALAPGDLRCFNLKGNAGRNILISPGLMETDFSVFKNNYIRKISETFNVQFRAEMFNIFNRANFAPPVTPDNTDIFLGDGTPTGVAGKLTRTTTTAREIQFALKVIF